MKAGASDFVLKPWQNENYCYRSFGSQLNHSATEMDKLRTEKAELSTINTGAQQIIGESSAISGFSHWLKNFPIPMLMC